MANRRLAYLGTLAGSLLGTVVGLLGFFLARERTRGMGYLMFLLVPLAAGFVIGLFARGRWIVAGSGLIAVVTALGLLIAAGQEGLLCALVATPLLVVGVAVGAALGFGLRQVIAPRARENPTLGMLVLALPVLLLVGKQLEGPRLDRGRSEVVSNSIWVSDSINNTWSAIQSIDSLHASKPWLMHVGLPVPQRCALEGSGVGARRICYFDKGYIEETVTEWDPPRSLGLIINRTHMPGRHWLEFETASYHLQPSGSGTGLTRTTSISSHLYPAWYWRPLERWGVASEHVYILREVANRAGGTR
jgi:hypothetical protein